MKYRIIERDGIFRAQQLHGRFFRCWRDLWYLQVGEIYEPQTYETAADAEAAIVEYAPHQGEWRTVKEFES